MGQLFAYSIISGVILTLMYPVYRWLLAPEKQTVFNRTQILLIYAVSLLLPLYFPILKEFAASFGAADGEGAEIAVGIPVSSVVDGVYSGGAARLLKPACMLYFTGVAAALLATLVSAARLLVLIRRGEHMRCGDYTLVIHDNGNVAPFSWKRYMVMSRSDYMEASAIITEHEKCHLKAMHWIDLIVAQVVVVLQWYNPVAWLMRGELMDIHEYQADEAVLTSGADLNQYQMLLIKKAAGVRFQSLANSLNHSNLKKRITMMYKSKSSAGRRFRALALAPALFMAVATVSIPSVASALDLMSASATVDKVTNNSVATDVPDQNKKVYDEADVPPKYPGDVIGMMKFLADRLKYPAEAMKAGKQGRVVVKFVVNTEGKVESPEVVKSVDPELDAEALRVVGLLEGFTPGQVDGKNVNVSYTLPVTFKIPK